MHEVFLPYSPTVFALGAAGGLILLQLVVLDVAGIRSGHVPGTPIAADHANFLFRAGRALANTNESIAAFLLLALFDMLAGASPSWVNGLSWVYVAARVGHMACYYAAVAVLRSVCFGVGLTALVAMLVIGILA